ncbi:hypothetical protein PV325_008029 [Microctonus aethiopoides]|nr:hypothetical protein PV325_008029 [Microctonus aethiopoides]
MAVHFREENGERGYIQACMAKHELPETSSPSTANTRINLNPDLCNQSAQTMFVYKRLSMMNFGIFALFFLMILTNVWSRVRPDQQEEEDTPQTYCGTKLTDTLTENVDRRNNDMAYFMNGRISRIRRTSGIVDECCRRPCTKEVLLSYCAR